MKQNDIWRLVKLIGVVLFFGVLVGLFTQIRKPERAVVAPVIRLTDTRLSAEAAEQYIRDFVGEPLPVLYLYATYREQWSGRAVHGFSDGINSYSVDADTGEVFAITFRNAMSAMAGPPTIPQEEAFQRAKAYAIAHVRNFEQFVASAELRQYFADGLYHYIWQEVLDNVAEGPSFVTVHVNGLTGEVAYYQVEMHPLQITVKAKVTAPEAARIVAQKWQSSSERFQTRLKVQLWRGRQTLVWEVTDSQTQKSLLVDADKGIIFEEQWP